MAYDPYQYNPNLYQNQTGQNAFIQRTPMYNRYNPQTNDMSQWNNVNRSRNISGYGQDQSFLNIGNQQAQGIRNPQDNPGLTQQEMSPFQAFSLGAQGVGSLANAWTSFHSMEAAKEQNEIARDIANQNIKAQTVGLGSALYDRAYTRARNAGRTKEEARNDAERYVNAQNLPTSASGGNFIFRS